MTTPSSNVGADASRGHTPLPWVIGPQNGHCGISIDETTEGARIATVYLGLVTSKARWGDQHFALPENAEAVANAAFIVRACNSHYELLEALEKLQVAYGALCEMTGKDFHKSELSHAAFARAAIAKARTPAGETK